MRAIGYGVTGLFCFALLVSLAFGLEWLGLEWREFLGPKRENVEREIFEETKAYNEGKIQQLSKYRLEHARSNNEDEKAAIAATVRTMFADYPANKVSDPGLRKFLETCRR